MRRADIQGLEGLYAVSETGLVFRLPRVVRNKGSGGSYPLPGIVLSQRPDKDGYMLVDVGTGENRKTCKVHRLVALAFLPNPDNMPEVDHRDFDRANNGVGNLRWASVSLNRTLPKTPRARSGITGIRLTEKKNPWHAYGSVEGRQISLGHYATKGEAVAAREQHIERIGYGSR